MKKIILFGAFALLALSCSKDSKEDPVPNGGGANSGTQTPAISLEGTWQTENVVYTDGKTLSLFSAEIQNCTKKTTITFSKTEMTEKNYSYQEDAKVCYSEYVKVPYTLKGSNLFVTVDDKEIQAGTVEVKGSVLTITYAANDNGIKSITYKKISDSTTPPAEATANAIVSVTGETNGVEIGILEKEGSAYIVLEKKDVAGGKASFDVKKHIGKILYFRAYDKASEKILSETEKVITEGENTLTINVVKKVYTAQITVVNGSTPVGNTTIYALSSVDRNSLTAIIAIAQRRPSTAYQQIKAHLDGLQNVPKATTNAQGVASFSEVKPQISNLTEYTFIVLKTTSPYYGEVKLTMNGTAQAGTINIGGTSSTTPPSNNYTYTITFKNTSSNPYTVTFNGSSFVVAGKSTTTRTGTASSARTFTMSYKQNSGYLIYPTEGTRTILVSKTDANVNVSFP